MAITVYTVDDIAELLQVSQRTVYDYLRSGKLKGKKIGKSWKVTEEALRAFLEPEDNPEENE